MTKFKQNPFSGVVALHQLVLLTNVHFREVYVVERLGYSLLFLRTSKKMGHILTVLP